jgi:hypothetical protein
MFSRTVAAVGCILLFASNMIFAQLVEKSSASFSFPTTLTSVLGHQGSPAQASFFRSTALVAHKGIVTLEWSVPQSVGQGRIAVYSVSGALVKNLVITKSQGAVQCDLSRTVSGIYLAAISYGNFRQNLKLALYK